MLLEFTQSFWNTEYCETSTGIPKIMSCRLWLTWSTQDKVLKTYSLLNGVFGLICQDPF